MALRQTAEEVESKRGRPAGEVLGTREELLAEEAATALAERVLALVTLRPRSQRLVRRAWRSAQRLGAELDLLYVQPPGAPPRGEEREQLEAMRRLASVLGAELVVEEGDDLVDTAARVAAERGTTYVLIGQPQPRTGLRRFSESLPDRIIRKMPGVDVRIVADRSRAWTWRSEPPAPSAARRLGAPNPVPLQRLDVSAAGARVDACPGEGAGRDPGPRLPPRCVPHQLSLDAAGTGARVRGGGTLLELIDQRRRRRVPVDSRIGRGRTPRHALSALLESERFDAVVVAAKTSTSDGFEPTDVTWLLESSPAEVLVLRPGAAASQLQA